MKVCAITKEPCFRWKWAEMVLFCDTCPIAMAHERVVRACNGTGAVE